MNEYPTDEELELFIEQMEGQELYAPRHMKEQILNQAFPKQTGETLPESGGRGAVSIFTYRLKIIAGMAAAIIMLMVIPSLGADDSYRVDLEAQGSPFDEQADEGNQVDINYVLNERMREVSLKINFWFGRIDSYQEGNSFRDNGGNLYEN